MKRIFKIIVILVTIILALGLSISSFILPQVNGQNVSKEEFSAERAMQYVEKIAVRPHPIGSKEHDNVRDYLINELKNFGLEPEIQKDFSTNEIWGKIVQGNIENIYCRLKGTGDSKETILISAHYDSTSGGPGAADDASGVATILETIRALKSGEPLKNDVIFLLSDGEEEGLLGAKSFVDKKESFKDVSMVINFEARGNSGPVIMFETGDNNDWFMKEFKKSVLEPVAYSFLYEIYKHMPNNTDFTVLKTGGREGFNFASIMGYETYHNSDDSAENLSRRTLQHNGNYALSLVKQAL
ncbi:M20/M25/M40 family metallo-hydrolase [Clostridium sp. C2-6-12]|uniref:M20/M25/M40 family metallo-hydrolase n=1 Tax=Clostridium sp. C2-6-12 TaxID=2698832 RepID=UPI0013706C4B|nr:M20/M25/M40 family metallo-hydrolase [Clostridium sp. C2-6-12]